LQVNGYRGFDYSAENSGPEIPKRLTKLFGASGTTCHLPIVITNPQSFLRTAANQRTVNLWPNSPFQLSSWFQYSQVTTNPPFDNPVTEGTWAS
jgi:hypothetical protein